MLFKILQNYENPNTYSYSFRGQGISYLISIFYFYSNKLSNWIGYSGENQDCIPKTISHWRIILLQLKHIQSESCYKKIPNI